MRRRIVASLLPLALLVLPACTHAAAGPAPMSAPASTSSATPASSVAGSAATHRPAVRVSPSTGTPSTRFSVSFRGLALASARPGLLRRYWVTADGPARAGCTSAGAVGLAAGRGAVLERARLVPGAGGWCRGTYHGRVVLVESPQCARGMECPMFVAIARRLGRFSFRVR